MRSNRWSRPKKDIVSMFDGLFFADQNSDSLVLITCFNSALADSTDNDGTVIDRGHVDQEAW